MSTVKFFSKSECILILIVLTLNVATIKKSFSQLTVNNSPTSVQLANTIAGPGITVMNVSYTGSSISRGSFNGTSSNLGIKSGVILASGSVNNAVGPNNTQSASSYLGTPGDASLTTIAGISTFDASILEFDFIPQSDTIRFKYVFGSEEYNEYVCSSVNDAFGFFISGPGIVGTPNIALIPNTTTPITINTVNNGNIGNNGNGGFNCTLSNSQYFIDNDNPPGSSIQYEGFTTVLTATAIVQACQTYHLKIAVADAGDGVYDSGVFIEENSLISAGNVNAGSDISICSGEFAQMGISNYNSSYTYSWTPTSGLSDSTIANPSITLPNSASVAISANYILTATDGACMVISDTVTVTVNPAPSSSFTTLSPICLGSTSTITYNGTASSNAIYSWDFDGSQILSGSGQGPYIINGNNLGVKNISLTVEENGCTSTSTVSSVFITSPPTSSFTAPSSVCQGESVAITYTGSNSSSAVYTWNFDGGTTTASSVSQGLYYVTWNIPGQKKVSLVVSENNCVSPVTTMDVIVNAAPTVNAGPDVAFCDGGSAVIGVPGSGSSLNPAAIYSWTPSTGLSSSSIASPIVSLNNTTSNLLSTYYILTKTSNGCSTSDTVQVIVLPTPVSSFAISSPSNCLGANLHITYTGNTSSNAAYSWNFDGASIISGTGQGPYEVYWLTPGTKTISLTVTESGCSSSTTLMNVNINPELSLITPKNENICKGQSATLIASASGGNGGPYTFAWYNKSALIGYGNNITVDPVETTTYTIKLMDNCTPQNAVDSVTVFIASEVRADFDYSIEGKFVNFSNKSTNYISSLWNFGWENNISTDENPSYTYTDSGGYDVKLVVQNSIGCIDSITKTLRISSGIIFYVPNAFTPNGDGINDTFSFLGLEIEEFKMIIYNRWGEEVFSSEDINRSWDGKTFSGNQAPEGVYSYLVYAEGYDGKKINTSGNITLLK